MSLTISGLFIGVIVLLAEAVGVQIGSEELTSTITTLGKIFAAGTIYWGRMRVGDLNWFGGRKV